MLKSAVHGLTGGCVGGGSVSVCVGVGLSTLPRRLHT